MLMAQHDFKSGQMIQIRDRYATYFTMLQTMVQNYSANNEEIERNRILNKNFETMKNLEDAQWNLKEYNSSIELDVRWQCSVIDVL
jgi:pSer/pThr/pTyr-binding forkhead associated (FHA) protein